MIYNKKYEFSVWPCSDHTAPKHLGIFCGNSYKGLFFMLMRQLLESSLAGCWLPGKPTTWLEGWNVQSHLRPQEDLRSWRLNQSLMANNLNSHTYLNIMKPLYKPKGVGFEELPGCWTGGDLGTVVLRVWKLCTYPMHFFDLVVPEL